MRTHTHTHIPPGVMQPEELIGDHRFRSRALQRIADGRESVDLATKSSLLMVTQHALIIVETPQATSECV